MTEPQGPWRLICPAEDSTSATTYNGAAAWRAVRRVATQLGLRCTWDAQTAKLYVGSARASAGAPGMPGVSYPAGTEAERHPQNNDAAWAPARPAIAPPLVRRSPDIQVSKHFRLSEFAPGDQQLDGVRCSPKLVEVLERIRGRVGGPIVITSGYRPPSYNRAVGGVRDSTHLDGIAADIYAPSLSTDQLARICDEVIGGTGGVGYYPVHGFVHIDVRGHYSRWDG